MKGASCNPAAPLLGALLHTHEAGIVMLGWRDRRS
jgi:hypothetical protein